MSDIPIGTDAWFDRRDRLWNEDAARLVKALEDYEEDHPKGARCLQSALIAAKGSQPVAPPLSFEERQTVRRFEQAAHGCCEVCEGVGEVQARLPHMIRWRLIDCPVCFPAVER